MEFRVTPNSIYDLMLLLRFKGQIQASNPKISTIVGLNNSWWISVEKHANIIIKNRIVYQELVMVTHEKPQILNCNIQFYFKSMRRKPLHLNCVLSAQFKCNGLHDSFEIELNITI